HARSRKRGSLWQGAQHKLRLPADAELGLDPQRAAPVLDKTIHPTHHVALQRREQGVAVAFESQRARLVQSIDAGLAQTAAEGSTDEPLQLDSSRRTHAQEVTQ